MGGESIAVPASGASQRCSSQRGFAPLTDASIIALSLPYLVVC